MAFDYVTEDFYLDSFMGTAVPADSLPRALREASRQVAAACQYAIGETLDDWPEFTSEQIRLAVCEQAEHNALYGEAADALSVFGGYSIGDVSVSSATGGSADGLVAHYKICRKAIEHLIPTGLLNRRLR